MLYNKDRKNRFIEENYTNPGTIKNVIRAFDKVYIIEDQFQTDLCEFNRNQLTEVLGHLDCGTQYALDKERSMIRRYIDWCTSQGYCVPNLAIQSIYRSDSRKYINSTANKNSYFKNRQEFYTLLKEVYNPQDKIVPVLLYEGINGRPDVKHSFEEIKNLLAVDCNPEQHSIVVRRDDEKVRIVNDIDVRSMDIIFEAINQEEYYKDNGHAKGKNKIAMLEESQHVVKRIWRKDNTEELQTGTIDARLSSFKKLIGKHWVTGRNILFSGMFDRLQSREANGIELTEDDYIDICFRFNWGIKENIQTNDVKKKAYRWNVLREKYNEFKRTLQE